MTAWLSLSNRAVLMSVVAVVNERVRSWFKVLGIVGLGACSAEGNPVVPSEFESRSSALAVGAGPVSADPGRGFACGLGGAGELYCWGSHARGQLGVGGAVWGSSATPVRVGSGTWSAVSTGDTHACGITGGALYCWGGNSRGQLGDNTAGDRATPTRVGAASDWTQVSAGGLHTCGLRGTTAYCWGANDSGQVGMGYYGDHLAPSLVSGAYAQIVAGGAHSCARAANGALSCWGNNTRGQLGTTGANRPLPTAVGAGGYARVEAGGAHTCAVGTSGAMWCTGANEAGQLGDGTTADRSAFTQVGSSTDWSSVAPGDTHTCGLSTAGALRCFGSNARGEAGLGAAASASTPTPLVPGTVFAAVRAGAGTCAASASGLTCFGPNGAGELGGGLDLRRLSMSEVAVGHRGAVADAAMGREHGCLVRTDGSLWCSGSNASGQLGLGDQLVRASFARVGTLLDWRAVTAGEAHTCAVRVDGRASCWGNNQYGQVGDGSNTHRSAPVELPGLWDRVVAGRYHTCGTRLSDRAMFCWGINGVGRLGDGTTLDRNAPVRAGNAVGYTTIALGEGHSCGLLPSGGVDCFGYGGLGALGMGRWESSVVPVRSFEGATAIAAGATTTCAIDTVGTLRCWGLSDQFQAGTGEWVTTWPVVPYGGGTWTQIAANMFHTCGVRDGMVACFGSNTGGQLGDGGFNNQLVPVVPATFAPTRLALGAEQTCAVRADGTLWCAGNGLSGQFGDARLFVGTAAPATCASAVNACAPTALCGESTTGVVCTCGPGMSGDGLAAGTGCVVGMGTDLCATGNGGCAANAQCTMTGPGARSCACNAGYSGDGITCADVDECLVGNGGCSASASCTNTAGGRTCACNAGYTGDGVTCSDVDECLTANGGCSASASCTNTPGSRTCACNAGYTGDGVTCSDVNECLTANGGCSASASCTNTPGSRTCACNAGYSGDGVTCADTNECITANGGCSADAVCTNTPGSRTCACNAGYSGDGVTCSDVNECLTANGGCSASASCTNTPGSRTCACNAGYSGDGVTCSDVNECLTANGGCSASASCTNTPGSRTCACNAGYSGDGVTCSDVNECLTANGGCAAGATCTNTVGGRTCACNPGYAGDGLTCTVTDRCLAAGLTCSPDAFCGISGPARCICAEGYTGDGITCTDVNECLTSNGGCSANAACANTVGGRTCACNAGFTGDGVTCSDVDECLTANGGCSASASCTNTPGSRSCACNTGYAGDGVTCADVNECLNGNGGCSALASCTNTAGGRSCACNAGYEGDGVTCADSNECLAANGGCSASASCTNTPGSRSCACNAGYTGDGVSCADVNECLTGNGGCSGAATCSNTPGGRTCACNAGYTGNGVTCTDVDECSVDNGGCSPRASCLNVPGSRWCSCNPGTVGDGITCEDLVADLALAEVAARFVPTYENVTAIEATATVCNDGAFDAQVYVSWRVSTDEAIDELDVELAEDLVYVGAQSCFEHFSVVRPDAGLALAGPHRFGAIIRAAVGSDLDEEDNVLGGDTLFFGPDLAVTAVRPGSYSDPSLLSIGVTVCNLGSVTMDGVLSLRLSVDDVIDVGDLVGSSQPFPPIAPGTCRDELEVIRPLASLGVTGSYSVGVLVEPQQPDAVPANDGMVFGAPLPISADLAVTQVVMAPGPQTPGLFEVVATVCNLGNVPGGGELSLRFSLDATIDETDPTFFYTNSFPPLSPGTCHESLYLGGPLVALGVTGTYTVGVRVQPSQPDRLASNDAWAFGTPLTIAAELAVTEVAMAPGPQFPGLFEVVATVCNLGNVPGGGELSLRFSSDGAIDAGDVVGSRSYFPTLQPGACHEDFYLGRPLVALGVTGTYTVGVLVEPAQLDLVTTNDAMALAAPLTISSDLAVTSVAMAPGPSFPGSFDVVATVCNLGNVPGGGEASLRFSLDGTIDASDVTFYESWFPPLDPGACHEDLYLGVPLSALGLAGTYTVGVLVEPFVTELTTTNDSMVLGPLLVAPDLAVVSAVREPTPPSLASTRTVICNLGNLYSGAQVSARLSEDAVIDEMDRASSSVGSIGLAAGECRELVLTEYLGDPMLASLEGSYELGVLLVPDRFDADDTNHTALAVGPAIVMPPPPCVIDNGGCSANATCTPVGGAPSCACNAGYAGDGVTCADVNECLTGNGGCAANAVCTNTPGSRTCACPSGYTGDGLTSCADVNECLTNNGGCSANATCTNTPGSRTCACAAGYAGNGVTCTQLVPTVVSSSPASVLYNSAATTVTVNGTNFVSGTVVQLDGASLSTTFVSATQLTALVPSAQLVTARVAQLRVVNPTSAASGTLAFAVNRPQPTIGSISPMTTNAGTGVTLVVNGSSFEVGAIISFNGTSLTTNRTSSIRLTASLSAAQVATPGFYNVTVSNAAPSVAPSAAHVFTVNNRAPTLSNVSPVSVMAGAAATEITLTGSNFVSGMQATFDTLTLPTTFVSASQARVTVPASALAVARVTTIVATNPAPNAGPSTSRTFNVYNPSAVLTSLTPATLVAGTAGATLDLVGSSFVAGAVVTFGTGAATCAVQSATLIRCTGLDTVIAVGGTRSVFVRNPQSLANSTTRTLTVTNPAPVATSMTPDRAEATTGNFVVDVTGTGFNASTVATVNGVSALVLSASPTVLRIVVDVIGNTNAHTLPVVITNPAPGGGTTGALTFNVDALDARPVTLSASLHMCRVYASGGVRCAGPNTFGALGDGTNIDSATPVEVVGISDAVEVVTGLQHTCVRSATGQVACWGLNLNGQLGDGTLLDSPLPVLVSGITNAVEIAAGEASTCARLSSGTVQCWGANSVGQLGTGNTTASSTPVQVTGLSDAVGLSSGQQHVCVRHTDNGVSCWGRNNEGQLGRGNTTSASSPVRIASLTNVVQLALGNRHTCSRNTSGQVSCWGDNSSRQVVNGTSTNRTTPQLVTGGTVRVATGGIVTCLVSGARTTFCGGGGLGATPLLGTGAGQSSASFLATSATGVWRIANGGVNHMCAERLDGSVVCWGTNTNGVMGLGTTGDVFNSPVLTPF